MKLKSIKLENFKNIKNSKIEFKSNNLSAIYGPNGSGKTAVIEAIEVVREYFLIDKPDFMEKELDEKLKNFIKIGETTTSIELEIEGETKKYKIILNFSKDKFNNILPMEEKILYKNADKIVTLTANKNYFTSIGVDEKKVELVSNGVDLEKYDISIKEESPIKFPSDKFNIVYTGKLGTANYIEIILDTAKEIKEEKIFFHIIGEGERKSELLRKATEYNLKNVKFYSPISKNLIPNTLKNGDAMLLPVRNEPLYKYGISPNKMYEYLASSRPIIFSGNVANDMVKEANAGVSVDGGDVKKLKDGILSLYNMTDEERKVLGKNGRDYVEKNYDTKILSKKLENIIARLLEDKNV